MTRISWIASYPKSGNTWLRSMLAAYINGATAETLTGIHDLVPDIHRMITGGDLPAWDDGGSHFAKTHFLPDVPILRFYREVSLKAVYLVRNPRDVLLSGLRMMHVPQHDKKECRRLAEMFIAHESYFADRGRVGIGSWTENLRMWTSTDILRKSFPNIDSLTVRYEDLRSDTVGKLTEIVDFLDLGRPVVHRDIQSAVESSTLERMREMEKKDKVPKVSHPASRKLSAENPATQFPFVGEGKQGQSLAFMGEDIEAAFQKRLRDGSEFASLARRFGYES